MADLPIIGLPGAIMLWYPTAMVHCKCDPKDMKIVILTGFLNHSECGACHKLYFIKGMTPDGKGGINLLVDFVIPTPTGQVM